MAYRPEIDGLRALAVAPVVLYHAGVPGFSGGFVGVDVFFVISGFLITSLIWPDIQQGRFSILSFYERRARRILPALFVVMAFSAFAAYRIFLNSDLLDFSHSLMATTAFVSNFHFLADIGYFAAPAATKPLLHTWSLAIEEQFYIFFPLLLLLLRKYQSERLRPILLQLIVLSFCISAALAVSQADKAFYLLHSRAWELLVGAVLALGVLPPIKDRRLGSVLAFTGISLILVSVFGYDHATPFPGFAALVPCLGTLLFIWSNTQQRNSIGQVLALKPVVGIGLISYSLYLWHWPLIVFIRYRLDRDLNPVEISAVILISLTLAIASWRWVERPFRGRSSVFTRVGIFRGAAICTVCLALFGAMGNETSGFQTRPGLGQLATTPHPDTAACFEGNALDRVKSGKLCVLGVAKETAPDFILWGDSHANALFPVFDAIAKKTGKYGVFAGKPACPPLLGLERRDDSPARGTCKEYNDAVLEYLVQANIKNIFLAARWNLALGRPSYELGIGWSQALATDENSTRLAVSENLPAYQRSLQRTLDSLSASQRRAWVILQVPYAGLRVPRYLASHGSSIGEFRLNLAEGMERNTVVWNALFPICLEHAVPLLNPLSVLCVQSNCLIEIDGQNLYQDDDHLSPRGAFMLESMFSAAFKQF